MGCKTKKFNNEIFTVIGHRKTKNDAKKLAKKIRKTNLARVIKGKDARGNDIWLVWASKRKKLRKRKTKTGWELSTKIGKKVKKATFPTKSEAERAATRLKQSGLGFIVKIKKVRL